MCERLPVLCGVWRPQMADAGVRMSTAEDLGMERHNGRARPALEAAGDPVVRPVRTPLTTVIR